MELVSQPIAGGAATGVRDAAGAERPTYVVVLATGFEAAAYLHGPAGTGRDGQTLHDLGDGEPFAFLGLTVPRFPKIFMMYGPNTNGGLIVSNLEHQEAYLAREIGRLGKRGVTAVEVRDDVVHWYNVLLQRDRPHVAHMDGQLLPRHPPGRSSPNGPYTLLTVMLRRPGTLRRRTRSPGGPSLPTTARRPGRQLVGALRRISAGSAPTTRA